MKKRKNKIKESSFLRKTLKPRILLMIALIGAGILFGIIAGILIFWYRGLPDVSILEEYEPELTTQIYDSKGRIIANLFKENRIWVPLEKIPKNLIYAVLAAEDSDFYYHHGINIRGIIRAAINNIKSGRIVEGGSTITQQLAKNLFLTPSKTLERKIKEIMLAFKIEQAYSKDKILELYLNEIYLGHGAYGVQAGAKTYFGKNVWELSLPECAFLAAVIKAPSFYSPYKNLNKALARTRYVIKRMEALGYISHEEAEKAMEEPLVFSNYQEAKGWKAPYFVTFILKYLLEKYGTQQVYRGGLKIYTTLDLDLQRYAEEAMSKAPANGALVALDPQTGFIKAMVGGKDFRKSQFNRATQALRQPGSAFKAILYTAAFDNGFTESTLVEDSPIEFPNGWKPSNYDGEFHGWVTIREAFEHSYNVVAVKVAQELGPSKIIEYARKMGIKSPLPNDLSIALGSATVTPLEMARAYACIANGGFNVKPIAILEVRDRNGNLLEKNLPTLERVLSEETAYLMIDMLRHVVKRGTGVRAMLNRPCGGKTGTTDNFVDAWFIGFTPELLAAVYIGNDDCSPLGEGMTGGRVAAPIWKEFMEKALKNAPVRDFPIPNDIVFVKVCAQTGKLPSESCPKIIEEAFVKGTEPTETCDIHGIPTNIPQKNAPYTFPEQTQPYTETPSQKPQKEKEEDDIEKRFQELLKKYGIKN
ncbi:MAG: PBP1A family penicillin-binding protein [Synergistetes bacterium]|nr:MAG: Membrane carboxypeptidase [bacterium 42_11]MBC7331432.1 PBP1A family penicillin-binding protein [Synergistota bacterium]MDK2871423.1 penicillin-binding protein [bacterium]